MSQIEEQEIPTNAIICTVQELDGRNYVNIPLYNGQNWQLGSPDKRVIDAFKANEYPYNELPADRKWHDFVNHIKRRKVWALVKQINRTRAMAEGNVQDVYTVLIAIHGQNNRGAHEEMSRAIGVWRRPKFSKDRDDQTEELKTIGVEFSTRLFEFTLDPENPESVKAITYLRDHADPEIQYNAAYGPDANSETIYDARGFLEADFSELMEMMTRKIPLVKIRKDRAYYQALDKAASGKK